MAGRGKVARERYWLGVIRDQRASGLSISAFCRDRQVAAASFFYWRRKFSERPLQREDMAAKFVAVELPPPPTAGAGCEVVLPDGCRVIVPRQCDAAWLREILAALEGRSC